MTTKNTTNVVIVKPEEADLVAAARGLLREYDEKARLEKCETGLVPAMDFFEEGDAQILHQYDCLQEQYRKERQYEQSPILYAPEEHAISLRQQLFETPPGIGFYEARRRIKSPTNMDLEQYLLTRVCLKRIGETVYQYKDGYYHKLSSADVKTMILFYLRNELSRSGQARQLVDVESLLLAEPDIEDSPLDLNHSLICISSGVLHLASMRLSPHSPKYFFTSKLQVAWNPSAQCPAFDNFLLKVTGGDIQLTRRFWEAIGYILVPDNNAKRFFLLQGEGDTGKSVLGDVLASFFDPADVSSLDLFNFGGRFNLAGLVGKRLNISMDLSDGALSEQAVSIIKQLTGQDLVQVEEKYKAPYSTHITCKLVFGTNHAIRLNATDPAFSRRLMLLPFRFPVPKSQQITNLREILQAEREGIFVKAIYAYMDLVRNGYRFTGDEQLCAELFQQHVPTQIAVDDGIHAFIASCCQESEESKLSSADLYEHYISFCQNSGFPFSPRQSMFTATFTKLSATLLPTVEYKKCRISGIPENAFVGLKVIPPTDV